MFTPKDIVVSNIMLELPILFLESECRRRPFSRGANRERSVISQDPPVAPLSSSLAPSPPSHPGTTHGNRRHVGLFSEKGEGTSLSFCPGNQDDKCHTRRKLSVKRKRDSLIASVDELTQWRDLMMREIENVRRYFQQLKVFNLALKEKKQEITTAADKPKSNLATAVKSAKTTAHPSFSLVGTQSHSQQQQQKEVHPQVRSFTPSQATSQIIELQSGPCSCELATPSGASACNKIDGGQILPDLKVWKEKSLVVNSSQSFDLITANKNLNRALAAQARQRRIHLQRAKKSRPRNSN